MVRLEAWARSILSSVLLVSLGCSEAETKSQLVIEVDAQSKVRDRSASLALSVAGSESITQLEPAGDAFEEVVKPIRFPKRIAIVPKAGDSRRAATLTATARDDQGKVIAEARLITNFASGEVRYARLTLESSCVGVACGAEQTCNQGKCVSAVADVSRFSRDDQTPTDTQQLGPDGTNSMEADASVNMCPPSMETDTCFVCADEKCCTEYARCAADARCVTYYKTCLPDCQDEGKTFDECVVLCDDENGAGHAVFSPYSACMQRDCLTPCGEGVDPCTLCVHASCAEQAYACDKNADCDVLRACLTTCLDKPDYDACAAACNANASEVAKEQFNARLTCSLLYCAEACEAL